MELKRSRLIQKTAGRIFFSAILSSLLFTSCSEVKPEEITPGTPCAHCKMGIVDMRFHSEIVTTKGRHLHFDSIECMLDYLDSQSSGTKAVWVSDYLHKGNLMDFERSVLLRSEKIGSPMGADLSAYENREEAESMKKKSGAGEILSSADVKEYIRTGWKKSQKLNFQK